MTKPPNSTEPLRLSLLLSVLMITVSLAAPAVQHALATGSKSSVPAFVLEDSIPTSFGVWQMVEGGGTQVVNPQVQQRLDKLYRQTLTRTYASADGYLIMLSIAYGDDQRGGLQAHMPELCYPAQGFVVNERSLSSVTTVAGPLEVKRIEAQMGTRVEPVTYWFKIGDRVLSGISSFDRRLVELRFALSGHVPDGLLFRVSSIDNQRDRAFVRQEQFVADLLAAASPTGRKGLMGTTRR